MVVGCDWSATGCRYSVTVALAKVRKRREIVNTLNKHMQYTLTKHIHD